MPALSLDIAFEANRRSAAETARASGKSTITKRIFLAQDSISRAGFLLLKPLYARSWPLDTVEERVAAFQGWVYAPFVGSRFMDDLTSSQNTTLEFRVYDGAAVDPEQLIYASRPETDADSTPTYSVSRTISVMG